jgi:hypothetical protein
MKPIGFDVKILRDNAKKMVTNGTSDKHSPPTGGNNGIGKLVGRRR